MTNNISACYDLLTSDFFLCIILTLGLNIPPIVSTFLGILTDKINKGECGSILGKWLLINAIFCAAHILASSHISNLMRYDINENNINDEEVGQRPSSHSLSREVCVDDNESKNSISRLGASPVKLSVDEEIKENEIHERYADEENEDNEPESQMDALPSSKTKGNCEEYIMQKMRSCCRSPFQPLYMIILFFHLLWLVNGIWELIIQKSTDDEVVYICPSVVVNQTIISIACGFAYLTVFLIGFGLYTLCFEENKSKF